ncbi:hypothetical protein QQS21_009967 [Conoideocrella luteorostrata]|uniref:Haloacid dehalogenase n=1 Tax=Conoideocrella luteorostrata TaxID=1105319 RepID=A0AAJ0FPW1_9HYPO|nr:hypothetical protein QQS21_009967 [Conoideocrella luteorostrata]
MSQPSRVIKAVFFDFMGTCLDWHSSVLRATPKEIPQKDASELALQWRQQYFAENTKRIQQGLGPENIDQTLARALDIVLEQRTADKEKLDSDTKIRMVRAWHSQLAWPDVHGAMQKLRKDVGLEVFVHANGTTRLQLDLTRSSGLAFNMLFSSQLLGTYKPSREAYEKALQLIGLQPEEVVMVAAHAYDLRGAQRVGMKTIYIHRWTDDVDENMEHVKTEFDVYLEDMSSLPDKIENMG